jgi:hypothetical protein
VGAADVSLFIHLVEGDTPEARLQAIQTLAAQGRHKTTVFAALAPDSSYAPTDWLLGPGCNCCLAPDHPKSKLLRLGMSEHVPHRVLIDAGRPALADRLAGILRALPCQARVNIITV